MIDALLQLGCYDEAHSLFWWFMQATALTVPELHVLYRLDGGIGTAEREIDLAGYRGSRPVRVGNGAAGQTQLDIYGALFETAWLYSEGHQALDQDTGAVLGRIADHVCDIWRRAGLGHLGGAQRAVSLHALEGDVLGGAGSRGQAGRARRAAGRARRRWRREAEAIRTFVETRVLVRRICSSYTRIAGSGDVDASLLMLPLVGYGDPARRAHSRHHRRGQPAAAARRRRLSLSRGRWRAGGEGCFLNCSFWLVGALARCGRARRGDGADGPAGGAGERRRPVLRGDRSRTAARFSATFPQALVHLALIDAAIAISSGGAS